jgi:pyridoxamine 5'-phosphate oxidase
MLYNRLLQSMTHDPSHIAPDFSRLRIEYAQRSLSETDVDADPVRQFLLWLNEAINAAAREPNAMTLATATREGAPSARIVLLKSIDTDGLSFFTNYLSPKARDLESNPRAALVFFWPELERQIRIEGTVQRTSAEESTTYFQSRPTSARVGSAASIQSQPVSSRQFLEDKFQELMTQHPDGNIPRPDHWGGYRVKPTRFEFWQGRPSRLHDRIQYTLANERWTIARLSP